MRGSKPLQGSTHIYAVKNFLEPFAASGPEKALEVEEAQGINLARGATKTTTLQHYIWSTLPNSARISNGKYVVPHFAAKYNIDDFIKRDVDLLAKTTFLWITIYGNNFPYPMFTPNLILNLSTAGVFIENGCDYMLSRLITENIWRLHPALSRRALDPNQIDWQPKRQHLHLCPCNLRSAQENSWWKFCRSVR